MKTVTAEEILAKHRPDYNPNYFIDGLESFYEISQYKKIIAAMEEYASSREAKWISVEERLPEKPGKESYEHVACLVSDPRWGVMIAMWNCEHLCWDQEDGDDVHPYAQQVTHWQPLPPPPVTK